MAREQIPALTGIRGVAALGVVGFHYWFRDWVPPDTMARAAVARGYIFVDLFFLLSGFVMASSYGGMFAGRFGADVYWRFLAMRLARIYPVYIVLVALNVAVALVHPRQSADVGALSLLTNATLTQAWFGIYSTIPVAWSLSAEWAAYLVFPMFVSAIVVRGPKTAAAVCCAAACALIAFWCYRVGAGALPSRGFDQTLGLLAPMVRCFAGFAIGIGVFRLHRSARVGFARSNLVGVTVLGLLVGVWLVPGTPDIVVYASLPVLLLCLALNRGWLAWLFGNRLMWLLGEWSYSIYLVHLLFIRERERLYDAFAKHLPSPWADAAGGAVLLCAIIAVSAALYTLVEVPARKRLRALIGARRLPPGMEPSAP